MHVTHLDGHALAPAFGSYSAPSHLRMEVPPQAAALSVTSPLAASSAPPFLHEEWRNRGPCDWCAWPPIRATASPSRLLA